MSGEGNTRRDRVTQLELDAHTRGGQTVFTPEAERVGLGTGGELHGAVAVVQILLLQESAVDVGRPVSGALQTHTNVTHCSV